MAEYVLTHKEASIFEAGRLPKLLYIAAADQIHTELPRAFHSHPDVVEIVFVREGQGHQVIDDQEYRTKKGDVLIYNSNVPHDEMADPDTSMSVFYLGMTNVFVKGLPPNELIGPDVSCVLHSGERAGEIEAILSLMYEQMTHSRPGAEEMCRYLVCALVSCVLQLPRQPKTDLKPEASALAKRIKAYIDRHFSEEVTLESMAEELAISPYYLAHVFKEATGYSPIQYVIRRRIGEAQSLLIHTEETVTKIAGQVGYDNISYFTTLFSKTVGMTPKKYRQLWRK